MHMRSGLTPVSEVILQHVHCYIRISLTKVLFVYSLFV